MTSMGYWVLDSEHNPVEVLTMEEWGKFIDKNKNRRVAKTDISYKISVSTVFLGIDHNFTDEGPPILFETMVFGEPRYVEMFGAERIIREDLYMDRYATWDEAVRGHKKVVALLKSGVKPEELRDTMSTLEERQVVFNELTEANNEELARLLNEFGIEADSLPTRLLLALASVNVKENGDRPIVYCPTCGVYHTLDNHTKEDLQTAAIDEALALDEQYRKDVEETWDEEQGWVKNGPDV